MCVCVWRVLVSFFSPFSDVGTNDRKSVVCYCPNNSLSKSKHISPHHSNHSLDRFHKRSILLLEPLSDLHDILRCFDDISGSPFDVFHADRGRVSASSHFVKHATSLVTAFLKSKTNVMREDANRTCFYHFTVGQNQEYRLKYRATRSSICSFARTAHSFPFSALLAALTHSLARSLRSLPRLWDSE